FVILTRLYDEATLHVVTRFMEMPVCNVGNAENLYENLSEALRLIKRILGFLVPARAIMGVPLKEVEYGEGHQLADEELFIGPETKAFMARKELPVSAEKKSFSEYITQQLYNYIIFSQYEIIGCSVFCLLLCCCRSVRIFYEAVLQKMFSSFPLDHPLHESAGPCCSP
ncbi:hypothetical protein XENOCAPTIV_019241, partial [Xenoophorus captivus]